MPASLNTPAASRKHSRVKTAVRKTVKWGGAGLTVVLVVVWIGSGWWTATLMLPGGGVVGVGEGQLEALGPFFEGGPAATALFELYRDDSLLRWWFDRRGWSTGTAVLVPLWLPAVLSLLATAAAWRADAKYIRRARVGLCAGCGYDRAGLAAGVVCPECGSGTGA